MRALKILAAAAPAALLLVAMQAAAADLPGSGLDIGKGDRVRLRVATPGFHPLDTTGKPDTGKTLCAPPDAVLVVDRMDVGPPASLSVRFDPPSRFVAALGFKGAQYEDAACADYAGTSSVKVSAQYVVERASLDRFGYEHTGWVYGPLVIPYKFHLHDHSFAGAPSLGAYMGRHVSNGATDASLIVASGFGLSSAQVQASNGSTTTTSVPLFTLAGGLVLTLSKSTPFQVGILIGKDWAGADKDYRHEGKTWVALSLGTSFGN